MEKKFVWHFLSLVCLLCLQGTVASEDIDSEIGNLLNPDVSIIPAPELTQEPDCLSAIAILSLITPEFGQTTCQPNPNEPPTCLVNLPAILSQNFYQKTTGPVTRRSLLDEPSLRDYVLDNCLLHIIVHPFYNYTPHMTFWGNASRLSPCYLHVSDQVINQIEGLLNLANLPAIDTKTLVGFLDGFKLRQHRAGIMFGIGSTHKNLSLSFRMPIYYLAEHFYLTDEEQELIGNFISGLGLFSNDMTSQEEGEEFGKKHLLSDRVGTGDMRINAMFDLHNTCRDHFWFGVQMTVPTAATIKAGLIGTKFNPCAPIPPFNMQEIINLLVCASGDIEQRAARAQVETIVGNFFIGAIDRLSTVLFNAPLGNGRHFGIGPQLDWVHELNEYWSIQTYAAFEGFSRHKEHRFFLINKNPVDFKRDFRNEANADENLAFLNQQIINTLYPMGLRIDIRPGYLGKFATSFVCEGLKFHGLFGFDYWYQGPEKIFVNGQVIKTYDVYDGTRTPAHQGKFFCSFGYRNLYHCDRVFLDLEFAGDFNIFSRDIGKSYTLGFRISLDI